MASRFSFSEVQETRAGQARQWVARQVAIDAAHMLVSLLVYRVSSAVHAVGRGLFCERFKSTTVTIDQKSGVFWYREASLPVSCLVGRLTNDSAFSAPVFQDNVPASALPCNIAASGQRNVHAFAS